MVPTWKTPTYEGFVADAEPRLRRALLGAVGTESSQRALSAAIAEGRGRWNDPAASARSIASLFREGVRSVGSPAHATLTPISPGVLPEIDHRLPRALAHLPSSLRIPVWLAHGCGWSDEEIGAVIDREPSAVGPIVSAALSQLRKDVAISERDLRLYAIHAVASAESGWSHRNQSTPETIQLDGLNVANVSSPSSRRNVVAAATAVLAVLIVLGGVFLPADAANDAAPLGDDSATADEPSTGSDSAPGPRPDRSSTTDDDETPTTSSEAVDNATPAIVINLDGLIELSPARRVNEIGPVPTIDFSALPDGWTWKPVSAGFGTESRFAPQQPNGLRHVVYRQTVSLTAPDGGAHIVEIEGRADGTPLPPVNAGPLRSLTIRGNEGRIIDGAIEWVENDRTRVRIRRGLNTPTVKSHDFTQVLRLAERLVPTIGAIPWERPVQSGPRSESALEAAGLIGGTLGSATWLVSAVDPDDPNDAGIQLEVAGDWYSSAHPTPAPETQGGSHVGFSISPLGPEGDVVVFGSGPRDIESVRLVLRSEPAYDSNPTHESIGVELSIVKHGTNRAVFAVPISRRLDPSALELLGRNGEVVGSIELSDVPPFLINRIDGTLSVDPLR